MKQLCVTFGHSHVHKHDKYTLNRNCVAVITAQTIEEADAMAFDWWKGEFHQHIDRAKWDEANMKYYPRGYIFVN